MSLHGEERLIKSFSAMKGAAVAKVGRLVVVMYSLIGLGILNVVDNVLVLGQLHSQQQDG